MLKLVSNKVLQLLDEIDEISLDEIVCKIVLF